MLRTLVLGLLPIAAGLLLSSATAGARSSLTAAAASKTSLTTTSSASAAATTDGSHFRHRIGDPRLSFIQRWRHHSIDSSRRARV